MSVWQDFLPFEGWIFHCMCATRVCANVDTHLLLQPFGSCESYCYELGYTLFKKIYSNLFIREYELAISSVCCFTVWMTASVVPRPGWSQEPGTASAAPTWVAGAQHLVICRCFPRRIHCGPASPVVMWGMKWTRQMGVVIRFTLSNVRLAPQIPSWCLGLRLYIRRVCLEEGWRIML